MRALRNLPIPDFSNFNWFPKTHAERLLPLRAEPEQMPLFHLGGRPGSDPEAMAEREALAQAVQLWKPDQDSYAGGVHSVIPGRFLDPGERPRTYAALRDAQLLAPETFKEVGDWTYGGMDDPNVLGRFVHDPELQGVINYDPFISPEKLKAHKVMAGLPAGNVILGGGIEHRGYQEALNTILHEMSHAETAASNPRWASEVYQDVRRGAAPPVSHVWGETTTGGQKFDDTARYVYHPDEVKAHASGQGYSRIPHAHPSQTDILAKIAAKPMSGWSSIDTDPGPSLEASRLRDAYTDWANQKEFDRQELMGKIANMEEGDYFPDPKPDLSYHPNDPNAPGYDDWDGFFRRIP